MRISYGKKNDFDDYIYDLIQQAGGTRDAKKIRDIVVTALKLVEDDASTLDIKILDTALKEIRYAYKTFAPYKRIKKVTFFGSARTDSSDLFYLKAEALAKKVVELGFMVMTGGGGGIMEAAQKGATKERSFGINIELPHEQAANKYIVGDPKSINFHYFFARKLFFLKETSAIVLFPGGFGTYDEAFEALTMIQTGKQNLVPIYFVDDEKTSFWKGFTGYVEDAMLKRGMISKEDLNLYTVSSDIDEVALDILRFYHNYHSMRYVGDKLVVRLKYPVTDELLGDLNKNFSDVVVKGKINRVQPFKVEVDDQDALEYHRIAFCFNKARYGRLRQLFDRLNGKVDGNGN